MSSLKAMRFCRGGNIAAIAINAGALVLDLVAGRYLLAVVPAVLVATCAMAVRVQTKAIRRRQALDRPRPDYAAIARMEREIFGE